MIRFVDGADDGGDHRCEGDFSREVCGAVERGQREQLEALIRKGRARPSGC